MKTIEIDEDVYAYIASQTQAIGESASDILRRLLDVSEAGIDTPTLCDVVEPEIDVSSEVIQPDIELGDILQHLSSLVADKQTSVVERFLVILSVLAKQHSSEFNQVLTLKGRNRLYFGLEKQQLLAAGSSTNPKQVPDTDYWVITNNNTSKKANMLREVLTVLGYEPEQFEPIVELIKAN